MPNPKVARPLARPGVVLAMLLLVYIFSFIDRQMLAILAGPMKSELHLSDTQLGALGGLAFALLYTTMAMPLGALADRIGRARVIGGALAVWSLFTALCGVATNYGLLFAARIGVGVGEAGGNAPSYALIADRFPPRQRARAMGIYTLGVPLGSGLGVLFGAWIAHAVNWRMAFVVMGVAGLALVIPFRLIVRDRAMPEPVAGEGSRMWLVVRRLVREPAYWYLGLGAGTSSMCGYGFLYWAPTLFQRSFHLSLMQTGVFFGGQALVSGVTGILGGAWLADHLGQKNRAAYALVPGLAFLACTPAYWLSFHTPQPMLAFAIMLLPATLAYVWVGVVPAAVQHLVEPRDRATASAWYLLLNNGIGLGLGPLLIGQLSDHYTRTYGTEGLRQAMSVLTLIYIVAAALMALAYRRLPKAWIE